MATETTREERIELRLNALLASVGDLPGIAEEWNALGDAERASLSLDWDHLMADYLTELDIDYEDGKMAAGQRARYRELLRKLREAMPIILRLDWYRPPIPLDRPALAARE